MKVDDKMISLKDVKLFKGLSQVELNNIKRYLSKHTFKRGDTLFIEKTNCDRILIVQSGNIKLYRLSESGKEQILDVLKPGETCVCNPGSPEWQCSVSAQALTGVTIWVLLKSHYLQLIKTSGQLANNLNHIFAERLCRFCSLVEQVSITDSRTRLIKFLLDSSDEGGHAQGVDDFSVRITHEEIAQHLGIVRETVTRLLRQLKKEELIQVKPRRIIIRNKPQLENIL